MREPPRIRPMPRGGTVITNGIGAGFVAYGFIKLVRGKGAQVHPMMWVAVVAFVVYFAMPGLKRLLGA